MSTWQVTASDGDTSWIWTGHAEDSTDALHRAMRARIDQFRQSLTCDQEDS